MVSLYFQMSFKHQFPEEIQSWIIGKRIPGDHETLGHCKIKGAGHSAYLYLRSPKSVGLTYEAYQKRLREQMYSAGTLKCLSTEAPNTTTFPFVPNGK